MLTFVSNVAAVDFCGEKLAWMFGITSPKYQYAIDEFRRLEAEVTVLYTFVNQHIIHFFKTCNPTKLLFSL